MIISSGIPLLNVLPAIIDSRLSIQPCFATIFGCCSAVYTGRSAFYSSETSESSAVLKGDGKILDQVFLKDCILFLFGEVGCLFFILFIFDC